MSRIVITGDRSANPMVAIPCVQQILIKELVLAKGEPITCILGLEVGIEAAVRFVAKSAGIDTVDVKWLNKDWDDYAVALSEQAPDRVYFIHGDAMSSKLFPALDKSALGERTELVAPELVFA